jgi:hypothetical protein
MQKKQSTIRKANTIGMLLMYLMEKNEEISKANLSQDHTDKLKNHGKDATDSCTSTAEK